MNIYEEVGKRHAQYQDGAITYSEFCNCIIALGIREGVIVLSEGELHDKDGFENG
jgi:hypothetical protein